MTTNRFWRRAVVATLLMLLALFGTAALGVWQYTIAHRDDVSRAVLQAKAVPISQLELPGEYLPEPAYGRAVTVEGELSCDRGFRATQLGRTPPWLVCPLVFADGRVLAVVLGLSTGSPPTLGNVAVALSGRLQPAQSTEPPPARYKAQPEVDYITTADAAMRWQTDVLDGYLLADPAVSERFGLTAIPTAELVLPPAGIQLRNLFYAWQWWIFAAFAVFIWGRYLRDEWTSLRLPDSGGAPLDHKAG